MKLKRKEEITMQYNMVMPLKIIAGVAIIIILYLFALNGRYVPVDYDSFVVFDKWKQQWIVPTDDSMIEIEK